MCQSDVRVYCYREKKYGVSETKKWGAGIEIFPPFKVILLHSKIITFEAEWSLYVLSDITFNKAANLSIT